MYKHKVIAQGPLFSIAFLAICNYFDGMIGRVNDPENVKISMEGLIEEVAKEYDLDPNWISAIITKESGWNIFAVRYEPNYPYLYRPEKFVGPLISPATEMATQKMSFGLGQVMGAVYREQQGKGFIAELFIPEINIKHMAIKLAELKRRVGVAEYVFAGYNGGPGAMQKLASGLFRNQRYVTDVLGYLDKLQTVASKQKGKGI
jgi:hypothetical protein